jgi:hypothetical protein
MTQKKDGTEFRIWTLTRHVEDDASTSPCQGEAINCVRVSVTSRCQGERRVATPVAGTPVEILRCAQDDAKKRTQEKHGRWEIAAT